MSKLQKKDFIEIKFTGSVNGEPFDSNIPEELKKINPEAKVKKTIIVIGERMVVQGLDDSFEDKEIGKEYNIKVPYKEGFGERRRELVKTIPLKVFTDQKVNPIPGATLALDNTVVKIITISGARVITDFNHPLAGKELDYKFTIVRKVEDEKEKIETLFEFFFREIPEYKIKEGKLIVKGPEFFKGLTKIFTGKFKDLIGKELDFEEIKQEKSNKLESTKTTQ